VLAEDAADLIAPFAKLVTTGRPWIIAKWAMTLDGKIATHTGDSRWISSEESRAVVHQLRGRVDAIIVGRGTVDQDDPLLTARPTGPRTATRIVLDSNASLPLNSKLVTTSREAPVVVAASVAAPPERVRALTDRGVEVWQSKGEDSMSRWLELLNALGRRHMTNVLVEGGAEVFGSLLDTQSIDEVHAFIAPQVIGGAGPGPIAGRGASEMSQAIRLTRYTISPLGGDAYIHGRFT
jgi:diaminohydroxyphosphoribosylaminopyrimidine deaminase/5-amino-6-(5-phosphoribosylamino)uracil reductase